MQLIRTLDTEYIDMIYKEKALDQKQDEIIPISKAVPGQIYIGAQCEEGNEMIYLGNFYIKSLKTETDYDRGYWNRNAQTKYNTFMHKLSPLRAFFAVPAEEVTQAEEAALELKYYGPDRNKRWSMDYNLRNEIDRKISAEKKQILANSTVPRYKILDFPVTSKRVKDLILTHKENPAFADTVMNKAAILASVHSKTAITYPDVKFIISNHWYTEIAYMSKSKETIELELKEFYRVYYPSIMIQAKYFEERYN
jgi:hypothetical protein